MTIQEYIETKFKFWSVEIPTDILAVEIEALGGNPTENYSADKEKLVQSFFYKIIPEILLRPVSVSQGSFSFSYDREAIISYYRFLCKKMNLLNTLEAKPTIKDISNRW